MFVEETGAAPVDEALPRVPSLLLVFGLVVLIVRAHEARGIVGAASPGPTRRLWIRAQRPLHGNSACRIVVDVLRRDDLVRSDAVLHPLLQCGERVVAGIV